MLSIWESIKCEFQRSPIGTLGALAAVMALFIANPEILVVTNTETTSSDHTVRNSAGLVTWLLLYVSVCYLFAKWGSVVVREKFSTGIAAILVFSVIAITIGVYLASIYLGAFPLIMTDDEIHGTSYHWVGIRADAFSAIVSGLWVLMAGGVSLPETISHDQAHINNMSDERQMEEEWPYTLSLCVSLVGVLILGGFLSHSLLFGLVEPQAVLPAAS